jgi:hypothetical protein
MGMKLGGSDGALSYKNNLIAATTMCTTTVLMHREDHMKTLYSPFKIFSMVVVLLMAIAMIYGGVMAMMYWSGIGV